MRPSTTVIRLAWPLALVLLLCPQGVGAQENSTPSHIRTAQTFLMAWGNQRWDELKDVATDDVIVKLGANTYVLQPSAQKSPVTLLFPFRGMSTVRVEGKVKGITVDDIGFKVGEAEMRGPGTITLKEEPSGSFRVVGVSAGSPDGADKPR